VRLATTAAVDGRARSAARVATNSARVNGPSTSGRTVTRGSSAGSPSWLELVAVQLGHGAMLLALGGVLALARH
jgi:hypothetical protein